MSITERVKTAKDARAMAIDAALLEGLESNQLPTRFEPELDGSVMIWFTYGALFRGRWDHSGERPAYVGTWFVRPRFDA